MKRMDFYQVIQPLTEKLYRFAYALIPDDLQAEQLVIDGVNAYLIKEKKNILAKELSLKQTKDIQLLRKFYFKGILRYMSDIGVRRSTQLMEQMRLQRSSEFQSFYALDPKVRLAMVLRFDFQFTTNEIEEIAQMPRYEVIEKLHNGKYLMLNYLNPEASL